MARWNVRAHSATGGSHVMRAHLVLRGSEASGTSAHTVNRKSTFVGVFKIQSALWFAAVRGP